MTSITLEGLSKHYSVPGEGTIRAVENVSLEIQQGEMLFLIGPSGCGKTTLLRMIAGLIEPDTGCVRFGDRDMTRVGPSKRNVGMVFQNFALWPHMTAADNVGFGLRARKLDKDERKKRVREVLKLVRMDGDAFRKPGHLSGGQQQRVSLARALVTRPEVLLLDEPLSNLDAQLRLEMRTEIGRICREAGITTVYVTHDQLEALSMADRIALMRMGKIVHVGPPQEGVALIDAMSISG